MNLQQGLRNGSMEARTRFTLRNIFNSTANNDYLQNQVKKNGSTFDSSVYIRHREMVAINKKMIENTSNTSNTSISTRFLVFSTDITLENPDFNSIKITHNIPTLTNGYYFYIVGEITNPNWSYMIKGTVNGYDVLFENLSNLNLSTSIEFKIYIFNADLGVNPLPPWQSNYTSSIGAIQNYDNIKKIATYNNFTAGSSFSDFEINQNFSNIVYQPT